MPRLVWHDRPVHFVAWLGWVLLLAFFFAEVEIQIEGSAGWAANLPTWRVESHWLLDLFWGGRAMTGYHVWVFSFMALIFHFPIFLNGSWSLRHEARIIASVMIFWICEDFLWFLLNPAFGWSAFSASTVPWHKHWWFGFPSDYWVFMGVALALSWYSFSRAPRALEKEHEAGATGCQHRSASKTYEETTDKGNGEATSEADKEAEEAKKLG